jgi:acyl-CoA hydrolase
MTASKMMSWMDRAAMSVAVFLASLPLLTVAAGASIL